METGDRRQEVTNDRVAQEEEAEELELAAMAIHNCDAFRTRAGLWAVWEHVHSPSIGHEAGPAIHR